MKKVNSALFITIGLFIAFLCGKFFAETRETEIIERNDPPRVFIEQLKTKMNITKNQTNIEIYLNGNKMTDDVRLNVKE